nr:unnamed protein product [Callosobruchus analis]
MEITQTSYDHTVNFTCAATEVYPTPKLFMYKDFRDDHHNKRTANLKPGTLIGCELRIPGTGYVKIKSHLFYPGGKTPNIYINLLALPCT